MNYIYDIYIFISVHGFIPSFPTQSPASSYPHHVIELVDCLNLWMNKSWQVAEVTKPDRSKTCQHAFWMDGYQFLHLNVCVCTNKMLHTQYTFHIFWSDHMSKFKTKKSSHFLKHDFFSHPSHLIPFTNHPCPPQFTTTPARSKSPENATAEQAVPAAEPRPMRRNLWQTQPSASALAHCGWKPTNHQPLGFFGMYIRWGFTNQREPPGFFFGCKVGDSKSYSMAMIFCSKTTKTPKKVVGNSSEKGGVSFFWQKMVGERTRNHNTVEYL